MFRFIPVTGAKQKLEEEKLLESWTLVYTTLKLNAIKPSCFAFKISIIIITHTS